MTVIVALTSIAAMTYAETLPPNDDGYGGRVQDAAFKRYIDEQVTRQAAGKNPPAQDHSTWTVFWSGWYQQIRISPALPWKSAEFRTKDDMIGYIKRRLKAHHLPTYD